MVLFQYFSDVHTEFYMNNPGKIKKLKINSLAPYLILAGDIGYPSNQLYANFMDILSKKFDKIFLISGNHEYYDTHNRNVHGNKWMQHTDDDIQKIVSKYKNIIFLQNQSYNLEDTNITIFGGTFWSKINPNENVQNIISDYHCIPNFTPKISTELHNLAIEKLTNDIGTNPTRDFIVISHHMPLYSLIHTKYKNSGYNSAFATDIDLAMHPQIKAWFYGHTHIPCEFMKFHANPIGYPDENINSNFNKVIDV